MIKTLYSTFQHWSDGGRVWITSDTHFDDWDCKLMDPNWPSALKVARELDRHIEKQSTLIHLGDVGDPQYMRHIHCRHKVLLLGNHDRGASYYREWFDEIYEGPLMIAEKILLSHEPVDIDWAFNIHGHDHNPSNRWSTNGYNVALNVHNYAPLNLYDDFIKQGWLNGTVSLHRKTINNAREDSIC